MTGALLAADLANIAATGAWDRGAAQSVLAAHEIRRSALDEAASNALQGWADRLRAVFATSQIDERCTLVNALLAEGAGAAYITTHDGLRPHLHFAPEENDVVARVRAVTAGGLAIFTVEAEGDRLGICRRYECVTVFVDTSRNGRRAYCSTRCGNSDAVGRHRDRHQNGRGPLNVSRASSR